MERVHLAFHFHFKSLHCLSQFYLVHRNYKYDSPMFSVVLHGISRITFKNLRPKVGELHALLNDGFMSFRNLWLLLWKLLSCAFYLLVCGLSLPSAWLIGVTAITAAWQELESPRRPRYACEGYACEGYARYTCEGYARYACEGFHGLGWSRLWLTTDVQQWTYSLWCSDSQQVHSLKPRKL